jgi:hypothetical protein
MDGLGCSNSEYFFSVRVCLGCSVTEGLNFSVTVCLGFSETDGRISYVRLNASIAACLTSSDSCSG